MKRDGDAPALSAPASLVDALVERARREPERVAFVMLDDGESESTSITYGELDRRARSVAALLTERNAARGRALLLYPPGLEYVVAFFGCLYAGTIAVPAYPPDPGRLAQTLPRLEPIVAEAEPRVVLTTEALLGLGASAETAGSRLGALEWLATDSAGAVDGSLPSSPDPAALAYLQYTSGSTAAPKGVEISHGNLLANMQAAQRVYERSSRTTSVMWTPPYHDMGLVGGVLATVFLGARCVMMPPQAFLLRPVRWLETISRYRADFSWGPNFAYDLAAKKVTPQERQRLDLSCWNLAINGAEPVRSETMTRFAEAFRDCGFGLEAFRPSYGLAEATVFVSAGRAGGQTGRVSCGPVAPDHAVAVVDPASGETRAEGEVGEIWIAGPSIATGYWGRPAETAQTFGATVGARGGFLRTGDLGFLRDGQLHVTGRLKDLIVVRGRNHYPQDLEETVQAVHPALRPGCGAAFSIETEEGERLVVVQELNQRRHEEPERLLMEIRNAVVSEHGVEPATIVLTRRNAIPRTSSGKLRRFAYRAAFLADELPVLVRWPGDAAYSGEEGPTTAPSVIRERLLQLPVEARAPALEFYLLGQLRRVKETPGDPEPSVSLDALGLDSLTAFQLKARIEEDLGHEVPVAPLLGGASITDLAAELATALDAPLPDDSPTLSEDELPLSYEQEALWFLEQVSPETSAYNNAGAVRIDGRLDVAALEQALAEIVRRHDVLRARFEASQDGEPLQAIGPAGTFAMARGDVPASVGFEGAMQLAREEAARPFDLSRGPLVRARLLRIDDVRHFLVLTLHHIVSDGPSIRVILRELSSLYGANVLGLPAPLPALPMQYAAYAAGQRHHLGGEALERLLTYWRQRLERAPEGIELPTDRPRPREQTVAGSRLPLSLPPELVARARELGRAQGATLFMTLLTAFHVLLHRYTGEDDIVVGTPITNRHRAELDGLVGFFANVLVLRGDLHGEPSFRELLTRAKADLVEDYAHQELPFELLVRELRPARVGLRTPLFQVMFALQESPLRELDAAGVRLTALELDRRSSMFDLTLCLFSDLDAVAGYLEYSTELFDERTIERLGRHFTRLLKAAVEEPDESIGRLPLVDDDELAALLELAAGPKAEAPGVIGLHELFEAQVDASPDATAIVFDGGRASYRELDDRANRLAHRLRGEGAGPEVVVGICLRRSIDLVVGLLAILKAGAAYVGLDPDQPTERLEFVLGDLAVPLLVAESATAGLLPPSDAVVVLVDGETADLERMSCERLGRTAGGANLAYAIYTSGSTGMPKAVAISHSNAVSFLAWAGATFAPAELAGVLATTAPTFDCTLFELFTPLSWGGTVVLGESVLALPGLPEAGKVRFVSTVPAAMAELLRVGGLPSTVTTANLAGDVLPASVARDLYAGTGVERVFNFYGPSEATTYATGQLLARDDFVNGDGRRDRLLRQPAIGRPIANVRAYVLDSHLEPVPVGVVGELCVGGAGVARGYLNRPELTAERFVPDPFGQVPGARLYRTGDLARFRADGSLEFLGRVDRQVKIRGFRVEPGEVEAVLRSHPEVEDAAVVPDLDISGRKRLVAYVVGEHGTPESRELKAYAATKLPDWMVPAAFAVLEALPRTPNGKVDRAALPPIVRGDDGSSVRTAPRTDAEATLCAIWQDVLHLEDVGVDDNFFELGGDSILSIRVVARANAEGLQLSPREFFQRPTIAELAQVAERPAEVAAEQGDVLGPVRPTPVLQWFLDQGRPEAHHYNQSVLVDIPADLEPAVLEEALTALVEHHDALRLRLADGALRIDPPGEHIAVRTVGEDALGRVQRSLDLETGPIVAAALIDATDPGLRRLLLTIHHVAVDAVSWQILLDDLDQACLQLQRGEAVKLPRKTTSFKAWSERLHELARSPELADDLEYWLDRGRLVPPLPVDDPSAPNDDAVARELSFELDEERTRLLLQEAGEAYRTTVEEMLVAALGRALAEWSGRRTLLLDLERHGRDGLFDDIDLTRTVGWFTAFAPILLDLQMPHDEAATIKAVKEQLRAVPRGGLGHGVLRYLGPDGTVDALARIPAPQVSFNYLGRVERAVSGSSSFALAHGDTGPTRAAGGARTHELTAVLSVFGGRLRLELTFAEPRFRSATITALGERFLDDLGDLLAHCLDPAAGGVTRSDFPLVRIEQHTLNRALGRARGVEDVYPLTPVQQGMLFHTLEAPGSGTYFEQTTFVTEGEPDAGLLAAAWQRVVDRHTMLRSAVLWEGLDEPLLVVHRSVELPVTRLDWRDLSKDERAARVVEFLDADREHGFELESPPLARLALIRLSDDVHRVVWSFHHLLLDGWSAAAVFGEVFAIYDALRRGDEPSLPRPQRYRDYVGWLRDRDLGDAESYWRRTLGEFAAPTALGVGRRSAGPTEGGAGELRRVLCPEATAALRETARRQRLTLSTLLNAAWALLLSRYSGEDEVVFGMTVSGRASGPTGIESMIGLFINTLPLRLPTPPEARVREWLADVQARQVELLEFEYSPLVQVQSWSELQRGRPLVESTVVLENYPLGISPRDLPGTLRVHSGEARERANYPLTLRAAPGSRRLRLDLFYDSNRFDEATAGRMLAHVEAFLQELAGDPDRLLRDLSPLTDEERLQLRAWNAPVADSAEGRTLTALFRRQAAATPEAPAAAGGGVELSYRELDVRSDAFAAELAAQGLGPGSLVGVLVGRGPNLLVALLGVLKAGAAYVPLDPAYPRDRLEYILEDSKASLVVTEGAFADRLSTAATMLVDDDREPGAPPPDRSTPRSLAYVMYTSGSTGAPKGVMVEQRGLTNYLDWCASEYFTDGATDSIVHTSPAFDLTITGLFGPLVVGGAVRFTSNDDDVLGLAEAIRAGAAGAVVKLTPGHLLLLAHELDGCDGVRTFVIGGEALTSADLEPWHERAPHLTLLNEYGPTETVVGCTVHRCAPGEGDPVSIGRPIANAQVYVLDSRLEPAPIGVAGELCIGGAGVARGYLDRPELTAERFVPDPFAEEPGARLYRTGDLARFRSDGSLEFLGRIDRQLKIRGYRVEPGEVEAVLRSHPDVEDAAVVARGQSSLVRQLVAYVVLRSGSEALPAEVRELAARRLPEQMVPSAVTVLDALPLDPHGKLDERALPVAEPPPEPEEPWRITDSVEIQLEVLFAEILGHEDFVTRDSFFEVGGHSLLTVILLSRVKELLGVSVPLATFLAAPTVEGLAEAIRNQVSERQRSTLVRIFGSGEKTPLFCSHPGGAEVFRMTRLRGELGDREVYGLLSVGFNGESEPLTSVADMASHYVREIRTVQPVGPYLLCGYSVGGLVAYEIAQQLLEDGDETRFVGLFETPLPTEYVFGPECEDAGLDVDTILSLDGLRWMEEDIESVARMRSELVSRRISDYEALCYVLDEMKPHLADVLSELKGRGLIVPTMEIAEFYRLREIWAKYLWAASVYKPSPSTQPVTLFRGDSPMAEDLERAWKRLVPVRSFVLQERHEQLLASSEVGALLKRCLDEAEADVLVAGA